MACPPGHISPLLWMDILLHHVHLKTLASRASAHSLHSATLKFVLGQGNGVPSSKVCDNNAQSPVCTVDHSVIYPATFCSSYSWIPFPWPFPLPHSMSSGGAANHAPPPFAKMISPRKGKYPNWACQGLELFSGKPNRKALLSSLESENWKNEAGAACSHVSYCCIQ